MKTIELFAGTRSFSKVAKEYGHETFTTDYEEIDGQDLVSDIRELTASDFPYRPDILWASPPCEGFSVAAIGKNWTPTGTQGIKGYKDRSRIPQELFKEIFDQYKNR